MKKFYSVQIKLLVWAILKPPLLCAKKWLILYRIISVRYQYLKPFNCLHTIAILVSKQIRTNSFKIREPGNYLLTNHVSITVYLFANKWALGRLKCYLQIICLQIIYIGYIYIYIYIYIYVCVCVCVCACVCVC